MDLRVIMDGVKRIVSGITPETTCKDIVLCLAQETKQIGTFILVERFQNEERLLNPNDNPLAILSQWGDKAPYVNFIVRRFDQQPLPSTDSAMKSTSLPAIPQANNGVNFREVHNQSRPIFQTDCQKQNLSQFEKTRPLSGMNSPRRIESDESAIYQPSSHPHDVNYSIYNASQRRPKCPPPYNEAIAKSSLLSRYGDQSSPDGVRVSWQGNYSNIRSPVKFTPKEMSPKREQLQPYQDPNRIKTSMSCDDLESRATYNVENKNKNRDSVKFTFALKDQKEDKNLNDSNPQWAKKVQNDAERYSDNYLRQTQPKTVDDFPRKPELNGRQLEKDPEEEERKLLEAQLSEIENQIATCQRSIEQLTDQITLLTRQRQEEMMLKTDDNTIKEKYLEMAARKYIDYERQTDQLNSIDKEPSELDEVIKEKFKKINGVLRELKESNFQGLSISSEDNGETTKGSSKSTNIHNTDNRTSLTMRANKSGSTKRVFGSPRELKNAVASSKNSHGVWV